jgi:hypothetical protein
MKHLSHFKELLLFHCLAGENEAEGWGIEQRNTRMGPKFDMDLYASVVQRNGGTWRRKVGPPSAFPFPSPCPPHPPLITQQRNAGKQHEFYWMTYFNEYGLNLTCVRILPSNLSEWDFQQIYVVCSTPFIGLLSCGESQNEQCKVSICFLQCELKKKEGMAWLCSVFFRRAPHTTNPNL